MDAPWMPRRSVAVLLALLGPGLGQLYLGRWRRGSVLLALGLAFVPVAVVAAAGAPSGAALLALLTSAALALLALAVGVIDAARRDPRDGLRPAPSSAWLGAGVLALVLVGLVVGVGGALWVRAHAFEAFEVPSHSMLPTIEPGDRVLVVKQTGWDRPLRRGDIVVYRTEHEGRRVAFVKRVVGLAGERVAMQGTSVVVDGRPLATWEPADGSDVRQGTERHGDAPGVPVTMDADAVPGEPLLVPPGHCYVLGDGRENSRDSREHGPVPLEDLVGVVRYRFWPPTRVGVVR